MFSLLPKTMPPGIPLFVWINQSAFVYEFDIGLYLYSAEPPPEETKSIRKPEVPAELISRALTSLVITPPLYRNSLDEITVWSIALNTISWDGISQ